MAELDVLGSTVLGPLPGGPEPKRELEGSPIRDTAEQQMDELLRALPVGVRSPGPGGDDEPTPSVTPQPEPAFDTADRDLADLLRGVRHGPESSIARANSGLLRGRTIGRYLVLGTLGRGGMGTVLKAYDESLDRAIAVKLLHSEAAERHAQRLRREAQALAKLSHPNVVHVYEVGETQGRWFIAMELVPGQTLRQWRQEAPRSWRECVSVYVRAGEGLAAAHSLGLVHRDFKPDNCIIDDGGRPRVLDFGLVGEATPSRGLATHRMIDQEPARSGSVDTSLTKTGTVMGTPAYMPPEQIDGLEADARSDQFSFCVALYEAVYGERPFAGGTMLALADAIACGDVRPAPKGTKVPTTLRKVLLRGLAIEPERRWPSMVALLAELRRLVAPRVRRWMATGLAAGLAALGGGLAYGEYLQVKDRCTGAQTQLEGVWDDERRQAVKEAILSTALSYAPGTWERVERRLDEYTAAWATEHAEICEATSVRHEQSEKHMGLRMGCLRRRRQELQAAVNELARADAGVVEHAVQAVWALPGLSRCADVEALEAEVPPPVDAAVAERVVALEERLAEAEAKAKAGKYDAGQTVIEAVVAEAETLGYEPLMARAQLVQGQLRADAGDYEGAVSTLQQAYDVAVAWRMPTEAAKASVKLIWVLGVLARYDEARQWATHAEPLSRATRMDDVRATYSGVMSGLAQSQGKYDEARDLLQRGMVLGEKAFGPDSPEIALYLAGSGSIAQLQGKYDEARELRDSVTGTT